MNIISTSDLMQKTAIGIRSGGESIGFVPTMGYLHKGHISLLERARSENDKVILSIFVNPTQFGPKEDLDKYPRDFERDRKLAEEAGVDIIFYPDRHEIYPEKFSTRVEEESLSKHLCGVARPGHFRGVTTVVSCLFNIILPHKAYFGQKDAQQALIIKRMVRDLKFPVEIVVCPVIREPDGLALSSRNIYLNPDERERALSLSKALFMAKKRIDDGERNSGLLKDEMRKILEGSTSRIDYISISDVETLDELDTIRGEILIAIAAFIGKTRLIDNIQMDVRE